MASKKGIIFHTPKESQESKAMREETLNRCTELIREVMKAENEYLLKRMFIICDWCSQSKSLKGATILTERQSMPEPVDGKITVKSDLKGLYCKECVRELKEDSE